jgi:hypothetical protein
VRDFRVPDVLPCPPFSGVKCIKGFKCDHFHFRSAPVLSMSVHLYFSCFSTVVALKICHLKE